MNRVLKISVALVMLLSIFQIGCGSKHGDALAVLAMAGTLKIIQVARTDYKKPRPKCNEFCGSGQFPCGDSCVPNGTLCGRPPGSACYNAKNPAPNTYQTQPPPTTGPRYPYTLNSSNF